MEGGIFLMVLPKLHAFSGEAHHVLRSRPKIEHSFHLGFFFQRELLLKLYLFLVSVLWGAATYEVTFS